MRNQVRQIPIRLQSTRNFWRPFAALVMTLASILSSLVPPTEAAQPYNTYLGQFRTVEARSNFGSTSPQNFINHPLYGNVYTGFRWECVEYMRRFYLSALNLHITNSGNGNEWYGLAPTIQYKDGQTTRIGFDRFPDDTVTRPPASGDILAYDSSVGGGFGHVAIIKRVRPGYLLTAQENWANESSDLDRRLTLTSANNRYNVGDSGVQGWLRPRCTARTSGSKWHPNGSLLMEPNGAVWLIEYDPVDQRQEKRLVPDEWTFVTRGWSWCSLIAATSEELSSYSAGPNVGNSERVIRRPDGAIFRVNDRGYKQVFISLRMFDGLGYSMSEVEQASSHAEVDQIPDDPAAPRLTAPFPEGTLVRNGSDQTVWIITDGGRRPFGSAEAFQALGYDFNRVLSIDSNTFNDMDDKGSPIDVCTAMRECEQTVGSVTVNATLDQQPWSGGVNFQLVGPSGTITRNAVPTTINNLSPGQYNVTYNSGGPDAFISVTPSSTQTLNQNSTVTFTINFGGQGGNPDEIGPNLSITSHSNNQTVTTSTVTISGTASDAGRGESGIASVTVNGVRATNDTATGSNTANWSRSISLTTGSNSITVIASDGAPTPNQTTQTITLNRSATGNTAPSVSTSPATSVAGQNATLNGTVNPNGLMTTSWFEWGTNSNLSTFSSTSQQSIGSGTSTLNASASLSGLAMGTTYFYRLVASNSAGVSRGSILSFTTSSTVQVTVETAPSGRSFTVDGAAYSVATTFTWQGGTAHTISTTSIQSSGSDTQYVFASWNDGGQISHTISPNSNGTFIANFTTQFRLTVNAGVGGTTSPLSNWVTSGQNVAISAVPSTGYSFGGWSGVGVGSYTGSSNPASITMGGPITEVATFTSIQTPAGRIAFTRGFNAAAEIYSMNADGSGQLNLTNNSHNDEYPTWSPDGARIAFVSWRDGNKEIYVMNADGSDQRNITNHYEYDLDPAWSPDGSKIAFHSYRDGNAEIYVMNSDGSNPTRLTYNDQTIDSEAAWSPDGSQIIFQRFQNFIVDIYAINLDGTNLRNLTNYSGQSSKPAWSPDGTKIAFTRDGIYLMNTDGTNQTNITGSNFNGGDPSWSPDGTKIAFNSARDGNDEIYVMNIDGSNQTRLTNASEYDYDAAWGPSLTTNTTPKNFAIALNGGMASASSTLDAGRAASAVINGDRKGVHWGSDPSTGSGWHDATQNSYPDWVQIDFSSAKTINEIVVYTLQDNYSNPSEPTDAMTFGLYGITAFEVQHWTGSAWITVPGGSVTGNNKVKRAFTFSPITTSKIRVFVNSGLAGHSRITEVEAWGTSAPSTNNVASVSNGGVASASSTLDSGRAAGAVINGDRKGVHWGSDPSTGSGWHDSTQNSYPDWIQIDFSSAKTINEIVVYTLQDNYSNPSEPTDAMTFGLYGITAFEVQYWTGSAWITVPGGSVTGNNKVKRAFSFSPITTSKVRVLVNSALAGYSRITEVEAYIPSGPIRP